MVTRRAFLHTAAAAGGTALAAFRDDGMSRLAAASRRADGLPAARRWPTTRAIGARSSRRSRSIAPSSISTTAAAARARASSTRRSSAIWTSRTRRRSITCGRSSSRTSKASAGAWPRNSGATPKRLAITRNASEALQIAQLGIDLRAGRRSAHDQPGLRPHARHLGTARAARSDQAQQDFVPGAAEVSWASSPID